MAILSRNRPGVLEGCGKTRFPPGCSKRSRCQAAGKGPSEAYSRYAATSARARQRSRWAFFSSLVCVSALGASSPALAAGTFLDAVLASVAGKTVTVTDVAIGRALSLFGLRPSEAPIGKGEVEQVVNAVLLEREAAQLAIGDTPEELEAAWRATADRIGGMPELLAWITQAGLDESWVKGLVETDLRGRRFIDLRFRAFAFVSDADVAAALEPGAHTPDARERTREALRIQAIDRAVADWLADARTRYSIGFSDTRAPDVSPPFSMPAQGKRH